MGPTRCGPAFGRVCIGSIAHPGTSPGPVELPGLPEAKFAQRGAVWIPSEGNPADPPSREDQCRLFKKRFVRDCQMGVVVWSFPFPAPRLWGGRQDTHWGAVSDKTFLKYSKRGRVPFHPPFDFLLLQPRAKLKYAPPPRAMVHA